jgi:methionyl-tRNA formyltransferase
VAFLGTPAVAANTLRAIVAAGHEVPIVVSRADRRRGREEAPTPSPVKAVAVELGLPVSEIVDDVLGAGADIGVVVAFGRIIKPHVLEALPLVNVHFSALPRWRGAAPVERAILAGDSEVGVCLMAIEASLDTGGVYAERRVAVEDGETAEHLRDRLGRLGTEMLLTVLAEGLPAAVPQAGEVTYADKITVDDLRLDWTQPAAVLARLPRVGHAWTTFRGKRLLVLQAGPVRGGGPVTAAPAVVAKAPPGTIDGIRVATGDGWLELVTVQPEGKRPLTAEAWRHGARPAAGERLGYAAGDPGPAGA